MELLAKNIKMGSVVRCCQGVVQLNIRSSGISLYFANDVFLILVDLLEQAKSKIMSEHVEELLDEIQKEDR